MEARNEEQDKLIALWHRYFLNFIALYPLGWLILSFIVLLTYRTLMVVFGNPKVTV